MKIIQTDVDIDVFDRDSILENMECIYARIAPIGDKHEKHQSGVYFQNIPRDPKTNIALLDYKESADYGFFKVDFLNVSMYEGIRNEDHLLELLNKEPDWNLFQYEEITDRLFHLNGYSNLLKKFKPTSVEELAMLIAIIRPSKAYLQSTDWKTIREQVWIKMEDGEYSFKKAHATSYALAIIVNLNLLIEKLYTDELFIPIF